MPSQKTRHQKLNSYWVMNSLGDKVCPHSSAEKVGLLYLNVSRR